MKNQTLIITGIIVVILIAIGIALFYSSSSNSVNIKGSNSMPSQNPSLINSGTTPTPTATLASTPGVVKEFTVRAFRFGYDPDEIVVNQGDKVKITIENTDFVHGMRIPELGLRDSDVIEFTADKKGEFDWFCTNYCGSGHSTMSGKIIVK